MPFPMHFKKLLEDPSSEVAAVGLGTSAAGEVHGGKCHHEYPIRVAMEVFSHFADDGCYRAEQAPSLRFGKVCVKPRYEPDLMKFDAPAECFSRFKFSKCRRD